MNILATTIRAVIATAAAASVLSAHAGSAPFDFGYRVTGSPTVRPSLVFNDGKDTYIQPIDPSAPLRVLGADSARQGPYIVVLGIPKEFALVSKSLRANITHESAFQPQVNPDAVPAGDVGAVAAPRKVAPEPPGGVQAPKQGQRDNPATQTAEPVCRPRWAESTQSVAIQFAKHARTLSPAGRDRIQAVAYANSVTGVTIHAPRGTGYSATHPKIRALRAALVEAGVPEGRIEQGAPSALPGMFVVDLSSRAKMPCSEDDLSVVVTAGRYTVLGKDVPIERVIEAVADKAGLRFVQTGKVEEIRVSPNIAAADQRTVLAKLGEQLGEKATLVLRNHELELNFQN